MAVFAPIPNAKANTATVVNPGFFHSSRKPNCRSRQRFRTPTSTLPAIRADVYALHRRCDPHVGSVNFWKEICDPGGRQPSHETFEVTAKSTARISNRPQSRAPAKPG